MRLHLLVRGRVQGVFFRDSARRRAAELGVAGWVRNLPDGRVECVAEGPPADVQALAAWCRQGPPAARVASVEAREETEEGLHGFEIRPTPPK